MKNKPILYFIFFLLTVLILSSVLHSKNIKINEIFYDPAGTDTGNEWIELYNADSVFINLENWIIEKAGTYFSVCFTFPEISIVPGEFLLIGESDVENADLIASLAFQNGGSETDGVRIISADGDTIDTILYDDNNSNNLYDDTHQIGIHFAIDAPSGHSLFRFPDGFDTDNCDNDFFDCDNSTPGEPNFMAQDLEIVSISILPEHPDTLEEVYLSFQIMNNSPILIPPDSCRYEIFIDDSLFIEGDISDTIYGQSIASVQVILGNFNNGLYKIIIQVYFSGDTQTENNIISNSFLVGKSPIIISEIMYKPSSPNIEWFEIYNRTERNFSLLNWNFRDTDDDWNSIETDRILPANTYAVISDDTLTIKNYYDENILFFQTDDWPTSLSNTADGIFLTDNYFTILDSTLYSDNETSVPYNHSLERINPFEELSDNWGASIDSCGATPGKVNSITPKDFDLCASLFVIEVDGNFITLSGTCTNVGFNDIENAEYIFFDDSNFNSQYDDVEEIVIQNFSIATEQSEEFIYQTEIIEKNYYHFGFLINANFDLTISNNLIFTSYNSPQNYPLPINEIQYTSTEDEPEWIELYNKFSYPIDISGWQLADKNDTLYLWLANPIYQPGEYIIIVAGLSDTLEILQVYPYLDSVSVNFAIGLPTLNNDEDILLLRDEYGTVVDSIYYFSDWGEIPENSLERVNPTINSNNPDNWESSINPHGATPGIQNSIFIEEINQKISLSITPNPVSLKEKKSVLIEYNLPEALSKVNVRIFDLKGRMICWLSDQEWIGSKGTIIWNCKDDNGQIVPIGIYIIYLEATGKQSGDIFQKTKTMVIGEK